MNADLTKTTTLANIDLRAAHEARTHRRTSASNPLTATCGACWNHVRCDEDGRLRQHRHGDLGCKCPVSYTHLTLPTICSV